MSCGHYVYPHLPSDRRLGDLTPPTRPFSYGYGPTARRPETYQMDVPITRRCVQQMYPLPVTSKSNFKKWAGVVIQKGTLEGFTVLWAGTAVSKRVGLHNIHILQKDSEYVYATRRGDAFQVLTPKYIHKLFGKYTLDDVPPCNKCVQPVFDCLVEVPFLPSEQYEKLQNTTSHKRKRHQSDVDFEIPYPTWRCNVERPTFKHQIAASFGKLFEDADTLEDFHILDPFAEFHSLKTLLQTEEGKIRYNIVAGFIYHYCRENLGYARAQ